MAMADNTYSRVIGWLKILLPLLALGILSTLFLVARTVDPAQDLPFADVDIDELAEEQRIGRPEYSAVTSDGAAISLLAERASPDPDSADALSGDAISADIDLPNGTTVNVMAGRMKVDRTDDLAQLSGGVLLTTSDGYVIDTEQVDIALGRTDIRSHSRTTVEAPIGRLTAGQFSLTSGNEGDGAYVLVFKGRVKLIYDPREED